MDKPWWTKNSTGKFTTKSAWEILRQRADANEDLKAIWSKRLPFKFSFLSWRIWLGKVHVSTLLHLWNPNISEDYGCCANPDRETIEHLFLKGEVADIVWTHYCRATSIIDQRLNLKQNVRMC